MDALCPLCAATFPLPQGQDLSGSARMPDGRVVLLCVACEI